MSPLSPPCSSAFCPCRHSTAALRAAALVLGLALAAGSASAHWIATWGASPVPQFGTEAQMANASLLFHGQTLREIVHTSAAGREARVRLSNVYGHEPVRIGAVSLQLKGGSEHLLTFAGRASLSLPPDAEAISDPVRVDLPAAADVAISIYLPGTARGAGIHGDSRQTSYIGSGNLTADPEWPHTGRKIDFWAFLEGLDVRAPDSSSTIVAFGDSITNGYQSTPDRNERWPDLLAARLLARGPDDAFGVVNSGIDGNRILRDAYGWVQFGVSALARFDRDVLAQPGVRYVIVLEGINDIGHPGSSAPMSQTVTAGDLIFGMTQMIERAHERGLKAYVGTLTPFEGAAGRYYTPKKEEVRKRFNAWIRTSRVPDAVIDFDKVVRDPSHPKRFLPAFDSGDHLHPNDAGY
ncbi:MAG: SGNH/GDSL hydrolase family protein, partial [Opitutaceae bacterium]